MSDEELAYYVDRHGMFSMKVRKEWYYTAMVRVHHEDEGVIRGIRERLGYGYVGVGKHKREEGRKLWWINFENRRAVSVCRLVLAHLEMQRERCELVMEFGAVCASRFRGPRNGKVLSEEEQAERGKMADRLRKLPRPGEEVRFEYVRYNETRG